MTNKVKRILIADDDPDDIEMLVEAFARLGEQLTIDTVRNGEEVLKYLDGRSAEDLPGVIILDYKMPILDGAEVLDKLKAQERYTRIPRIIWSTSGQEEDMKRCIHNGARRYFIKPARVNELELMARQMLGYCIS